VSGKAGGPVEFGAKLSVSCFNGCVFLDQLRWDNFNESTHLQDQVEAIELGWAAILSRFMLTGFIVPATIATGVSLTVSD
jgi:hypothetical protein